LAWVVEGEREDVAEQQPGCVVVEEGVAEICWVPLVFEGQRQKRQRLPIVLIRMGELASG